MPKFYQDNVKIQFSNTHVKLEGFSSSRKANKQKKNWVRLAEHERIPTDVKYMNPRISFDGLNWWISVCVEFPDCKSYPIHFLFVGFPAGGKAFKFNMGITESYLNVVLIELRH